jgi:hypothetical protein
MDVDSALRTALEVVRSRCVLDGIDRDGRDQ